MAISSPTADFVTTALSGAVAVAATSATIGTGLNLPATDGILQFDYTDALGAGVGADNGPETIKYATYTSASGALTGMTRGQAGTTDVAHGNGALVACAPSSIYLQNFSPLFSNSAWTAWTPTLNTSGSPSTAPTYTAHFISNYMQIGKMVFGQISWQNATGGTAGSGTGAITATLPVAAHANNIASLTVIGSGQAFESGGGTVKIVSVVAISSTVFELFVDMNNPLRADDQSSDTRSISATFMYEAA